VGETAQFVSRWSTGLYAVVTAMLLWQADIAHGQACEEQQKLTASDMAESNTYGYSVSIDGDTMIVGAIFANTGGAAYVFTRSGTTWTEQQKLTASDMAVADLFGWSVSISGDTAIVGAPKLSSVDNPNSGAAYVFIRSGGTWIQQQKLTASDGGLWHQRFGQSVSISGDVVIVGDHGANLPPSGPGLTGAAYVFTRSGTTWTEQQKLTASDMAAGDNFGWSVSISSDTAIIGARLADPGDIADAGAAYVFTRSGTTWTEQQKLAASQIFPNEQFGRSVSISGDTAIFGASESSADGVSLAGAAYVFTRSGNTWSQQQRLTASDMAFHNRFGWSVSISGDTAVIGARTASPDGLSQAGVAYVFTRSGNTWTQQQKLTASDMAAGDRFGQSVSIDGDTAIVGAAFASPGGVNNAGAAYVFDCCPQGLRFLGGQCQEFGVCCYPDGTCMDDLAPGVCPEHPAGFAGTWMGFDSECETTDCFGACCYADGSCATADILGLCPPHPNEIEGVWQGYASTCKLAKCDGGVCCYPNTECIPVLPDGTCPPGPEGAVGVWMGVGSNCDDADCGCPYALEQWKQWQEPWKSQWYGASANGETCPDFGNAGFDTVQILIERLDALALEFIDSTNEPIPQARLLQFFTPKFLSNATWFPDVNDNGTRFDVADLLDVIQTLECRRQNSNIHAVGCTITSWALAANAVHGSTVTPGQLYEHLRTPFQGRLLGFSQLGRLGRYSGGSGTTPRFEGMGLIHAVAAKHLGLKFQKVDVISPELLALALDQCIIIIIFDGSHWSVIERYRINTNGEYEFYESDPAFPNNWHLVGSTQWNKWASAGSGGIGNCIFVEDINAVTTTSSGSPVTVMQINSSHGTAMLVTDPSGNRLGIDPETGEVFAELAGTFDRDVGVASFEDELTPNEFQEMWAEAPPIIFVNAPSLGQYTIDVDSPDTLIQVSWLTESGEVVQIDVEPSNGQVTVDVALPATPGDLNNDGVVNVSDLLILLGAWGTCPNASTCPADLNDDGVVNVSDLLLLLGNWG